MNARAELPFDTCLQEALSLSGGWMARWVAQLGAALSQQEVLTPTSQGKRGQAQARAALAACSERLAQRWHATFTDAVRADIAREGRAASGSRSSAQKMLSLHDLELMDHGQVQASVELARLHQVIKLAVDDDLIVLTALLSAAQGLRSVRPEANPLRPEVVVESLTTALVQLNVDDASRQRWFHAGAVALGQALKGFYGGLIQRLELQGVQPAGFVVVPVTVPRGVAAANRGAAAIANEADGQPLVLTLDHLHQLLVGNLAHSGSGVSDQGTSGSGNAMVRTLAGEVVAQMLRSIADDRRLLEPVRDLVLQLKPALLHLAKTDPRFFADRNNPARRLLEVITARGLAFSSEQDTGFADFALQVQLTVQSLQTPSAGLPERFAERMRRLASFGPPEDGTAMQTLVRVEQRHLLAERVASEIRSRPDFARAPALVRRFLVGPWAQVIAHARLHVEMLGDAPLLAELPSEQDAPALRYMDILGDLLWSCQLSQASQNRPRLIRVIPLVLRTLREGLDTIDFPRAQAESIFQMLMGLHEAAYKTHRSEDFINSSLRRSSDAPREPWLHGSEASASGFIDTQLIEPDFLDTVPMSAELQVAETLSVGAWVELQQAQQSQRCQLRWASPHRTMFLFATADGRPVSLTRHGMDRLTALGRLRVVAEQGVVDEALAAVARLAWVNSGKLG
ncbi:DUF1631 family protein [Hydrogenophaga sp. MI9]|uniref:DUF1631 family protein n=1 Tax=Hydrogenophaga sp. MI9 TaxID=3453719 RepID=UPI003EEAA8F8